MPARIAALMDERKKLERELSDARKKLAMGGGAAASRKVTLDPILGAYVESSARADVFKTDMRVERATANIQGGPQDVFKQEVLWQRWEEET